MFVMPINPVLTGLIFLIAVKEIKKQKARTSAGFSNLAERKRFELLKGY